MTMVPRLFYFKFSFAYSKVDRSASFLDSFSVCHDECVFIFFSVSFFFCTRLLRSSVGFPPSYAEPVPSLSIRNGFSFFFPWPHYVFGYPLFILNSRRGTFLFLDLFSPLSLIMSFQFQRSFFFFPRVPFFVFLWNPVQSPPKVPIGQKQPHPYLLDLFKPLMPRFVFPLLCPGPLPLPPHRRGFEFLQPPYIGLIRRPSLQFWFFDYFFPFVAPPLFSTISSFPLLSSVSNLSLPLSLCFVVFTIATLIPLFAYLLPLFFFPIFFFSLGDLNFSLSI